MEAHENSSADGTTTDPAPVEPEDYYRPPGRAEPLNGRTVLPIVKRFNRKTVGVLLALGALVTVAALGTALTRQRQGKASQDSAAQSAVAIPTPTDAISTLPSNYGQLSRGNGGANSGGAPQLGPKLPGDIGAFAPPVRAFSAAAMHPRPLTPWEQSMLQAQLEELKRAAKAREGGFGFGGGAAATVAGSVGNSPAPGIAASLDHGLSSLASSGLNQSLAARDSDNRQDDKSNFATADRKASWLLRSGVQVPLSPYTVFAGAVLPGVMITGINSDLPGQIEGQISQNVYDTVSGQHLLLPQGTKVLGTYDSRITYGQSRVLVVWTRLIRPDGSNIDLEGMPGVDMSGYAGEPGKVDRHLTRLLSAVLLGSLIQAGTSAGTSYTNPSFADLARQGAGQGVNEATQQIVRKELNIQPTITVTPGTRFNVFTTKDMILPPYEG